MTHPTYLLRSQPTPLESPNRRNPVKEDRSLELDSAQGCDCLFT